jgi:hypothetical protein
MEGTTMIPIPIGERRLYAAILEDAIQVLLHERRGRLWSDTHAWFFDDFDPSPFAFRTVCLVLGFDAGAVRRSVIPRLERSALGDTTDRLRGAPHGVDPLPRRSRRLAASASDPGVSSRASEPW